MKDLPIRGDLLPPGIEIRRESPDVGKNDKSFNAILKESVQEINQLQKDADNAITKVESGDAGSIHDAMIALEKADISFRTMMQVRNKLLDAYQEVMRMQV